MYILHYIFKQSLPSVKSHWRLYCTKNACMMFLLNISVNVLFAQIFLGYRETQSKGLDFLGSWMCCCYRIGTGSINYCYIAAAWIFRLLYVACSCTAVLLVLVRVGGGWLPTISIVYMLIRFCPRCSFHSISRLGYYSRKSMRNRPTGSNLRYKHSCSYTCGKGAQNTRIAPHFKVTGNQLFQWNFVNISKYTIILRHSTDSLTH